MASTGYDETLLASAPVATRAQIQDGYNAELLNPNRAKATPPPARDPEAALSKEHLGYATSPKVPFWRTRKGIIIIVIAGIVVIAAVVGGAVGGTKKGTKTTLPSGSTTASTISTATLPLSSPPVVTQTGESQAQGSAPSTSQPAITQSAGTKVEEANTATLLQGIHGARAIAW